MVFVAVGRTSFLKNVKICGNVYQILRQVSSNTEPNVIKSKVDITIPSILLEEYVWKGLHKWHNKTALVCAETGRSYLYSEVFKKSGTLANFLHKFHKLKQNDTIAIVLPNVPEYPIVMLGAIQAGLKITTVNPVYTADEIARQLLNSETKLIFTLTELWPKVNQAIKALKCVVPVVVIEQKQNESTPLEAIKFKEITEGDYQLNFQISRSVEDVIVLPYSSGTTGVPKGVELSNKNIVSNLHQMSAAEFKLHNDAEGTHQEVIPAVLPMFHIYGMMMCLLNMLSSGSKLVTIPKFGSKIFLKVLEEYQPTFGYLVPPIILLLLNNPQIQPKHLSQMRTIFSGAAPLGAADVERLRKKSCGKVNLLQAYGLTEASPLTLSQTHAFTNGNKLGGSGFSIPNTECKIVSVDDETKTGLGPNQSGELLIRGPQIMKGYYKNVDATKSVLDSSGWLRTGDIAHYDEDEHFSITDRLKELIKVKGFQVAPAELEELLRDHPDVEEAAVIGVPHSACGEVPKAFIIPKANCTVNSLNIQEYIKNKVADYKQLVGGVAIVGSIPKTPSGKILRRQLKEL